MHKYAYRYMYMCTYTFATPSTRKLDLMMDKSNTWKRSDLWASLEVSQNKPNE